MVLVFLSVPLGYSLVVRRAAVLRAVTFAAELPYAVPGVVLAIAMILCLLRPLPLLGFSLYSTIWIILVAYLSRFLLLALRPVTNALQQIDPSLDEAARMTVKHAFDSLHKTVYGQSAPNEFGHRFAQSQRTARRVALHEVECIIVDGQCRTHANMMLFISSDVNG